MFALWAAIAIITCLAALVTLVLAAFGFVEFGPWWGTAILLGTLVLCGAAALTVRQADWTGGHNICKAKAATTGFEIEWRDLTYWTYDCYANVDGRWVPVDQIRLVVNDD